MRAPAVRQQCYSLGLHLGFRACELLAMRAQPIQLGARRGTLLGHMPLRSGSALRLRMDGTFMRASRADHGSLTRHRNAAGVAP